LNSLPPSIFNDVIGPVMRGPSSSHTAAAVRIGKLIRQFFQGEIERIVVEVTPEGSLATTYRSQGSEIGLLGGLLGMEPDDDRLLHAVTLAMEEGIDYSFIVTDFAADHPSTYRIKAAGKRSREYELVFLSTGGGMIELIEIDATPVSVKGDYFETILFGRDNKTRDFAALRHSLVHSFPAIEDISVHSGGAKTLLIIKTCSIPDEQIIHQASKSFQAHEHVLLQPMLPVLSYRDIDVPFLTAEGVLEAAAKSNMAPWELAIEYECARGRIDKEEVMSMGRHIVSVMKDSLKTGLAGTEFSDRILKPQAYLMLQRNETIFGGVFIQKLIAYITAIMETKSSMGVIVAAPTAGSCAALPGTLFTAAEALKADEDALTKALLAAGLVGILIASGSTFAAEEAGCQAECGSASAMAAAGLVQMAGGDITQAFAAASMALQNVMCLVCDPVANRVEVPCLGKNILAGTNAVTAANMALAGFSEVIPLDQTIAASNQAGRMLPFELRCTGKAGLSVTPASKMLRSDK